MKSEKNLTTKDRELIVLASIIAPETSTAAVAALKTANFDPVAMFTDPEVRDNFDVFLHNGPTIFGNTISGRKITSLATPYIERHLAHLAATHKRQLVDEDRTLDTFETPGPDTSDPDCLFQNRWLRRGACGAIVSTSGVGKSSFSMQAAAVWAGGKECLGVKPLRPLKIGIFQNEDDEYDVANFRDRIRIGLVEEMGWTDAQIREAERQVTFCALDGSTGPRFIEHLRRKQEKHHFDLLIINPLFAFFGGDMNDGNAMTAFLRHGIDPLIKDEKTKCGCIIIHHTGKPNKDAMSQGDVFKAYLGSGSGEFTNYIRSALVITPWNGGKLPGVFELIGAKHGDKLGWRDDDGKPTNKKTICYANRLPEYANKGMIFWVEPDETQLAEMKKTTNAGNTPKTPLVSPLEKVAQVIAELIRKQWTPTTRPSSAKDCGQRDWVLKLKKTQTGGGRTTNEAAYNLIAGQPGRFGLREIQGKRKPYFVAASTPIEADEIDDLNPEQEDLF
jgi:hypothetical protein